MRTYPNPFRARASEHHTDHRAFLRNFAGGMLDLLPSELWDRPLVLRSAPGAGKTSLMRVFTAPSLALLHEDPNDFRTLHERLEELGALGPAGPQVLGVLLNLERDYRALTAVGAPEDVSLRLFFRLLDARIMATVVRAALSAADETDPATFLLHPTDGSEPDLVDRLGGLDGPGILAYAQGVEREVANLLDSLLPVRWADVRTGHADLYSLTVLSTTTIEVAGRALPMRPLLMLDDGHALAPHQREQLVRRLMDRKLGVGRWYAERFEALSTKELMEGTTEGRDYILLELEALARGRGQRRSTAFERILVEAGNLRAGRSLARYADEDEDFFELLEVEPDELLGQTPGAVVAAARNRLEQVVAGRSRYADWVTGTDRLEGYAAALRCRELEILIRKDERRAQQQLFEITLDEDELVRSQSSRVAEAARLFLAREHGLPFYCGPEVLPRLGSQNVEQFLTLCGDLFEQMLARLTLKRRPRIGAGEQDTVVRRASERLWLELPRRVPHGRDVQRFLVAVLALAQSETFRDTAPYAPGVTGVALAMRERERLLDADTRAAMPGAQSLFDAIGSAVAHNVVSVTLDYSVKGDRVMVIYLNRLLCPRFMLPLGRGGFRERRLEEMAGWLADTKADRALEIHAAEQLPL